MRKKVLFIILLSTALFIETFIIKGIPVLIKTFPMDNAEAVLFSLQQNIAGAQNFTTYYISHLLDESWLLFLVEIVSYTTITGSILFLFRKKIKSKGLFFVIGLGILNLLSLAIASYEIINHIPVKQYVSVYFEALKTPSHSKLYQTEYVFPDSTNITFKKKNNLILLFLESMEYNFQDSANGGNLSQNLIPELSKLIHQEQSFIPGGDSIYGAGWTIAEVVAKTCGIPLIYPKGTDKNIEKLSSFLPGAKCLTDVLFESGYNIEVSKGSWMTYASMSSFLKTHSNPKPHDLKEYWQDQRFVNDTATFWGVADSLHLQFVREHITRLSQQPEPWMMWAFTSDTHTPYGHLDPKCIHKTSVAEKDQYPLVIRCSDKTISNFIDWAKQQEWFSTTTIVIVGDHATMAAPEIVGFKEKNIKHYWLNIFINSLQIQQINKREFTSFDMFPTILEAIGANIQGRSLGLGRSLYAEEKTLTEKYGIDSLNKMLQRKSIEYNYFLYGN